MRSLELSRRPVRSAAARMTGAALTAGQAALILFGLFFLFLLPAGAGRLRAGARLPAGARPRAAPLRHGPRAGDLQRLQFLYPLGGAVLPPHRQPHECRRHHRQARAPLPHHGRALAGRPRPDQRGAVDLLRRHLRLLHSRRRQPVEDLHRGAAPGGLRRQLLRRHHGRLSGARRHHPAVHPDDRLGRHPVGLDRRPVPGRHHPGPPHRARADGDRPCLREGARLSDLSSLELGRARAVAARLAAGLDHARHHHRRQDLRLVHGHRIRLHRRALRRRAVARRLPGDGPEGPPRRPARHRQAGGGRPVLRRHRERLRLAARLLPDPEDHPGGRRRAGAWD